MTKRAFAAFVMIAVVVCVWPGSAVVEAGPNQQGRCIFTFFSKGTWGTADEITPYGGIANIADTAHKYDVPVTWIIKPKTARGCAALFKVYHDRYGDEIAYLADGPGGFGKIKEEIQELRGILPWAQIEIAGKANISKQWVEGLQQLGIKAIWGKCWEQTFADGISHNGSPWGVHYIRPETPKVPNLEKGGVLSLEWTARDLNLAFRTGWPEIFSTDPDDVLELEYVGPGQTEFWKAMMDEYKRNAVYNKIVPVVVHDEYQSCEMRTTWISDYSRANKLHNRIANKLAIFSELFEYVQKSGIEVMTGSEFIKAYKQAYDETPPTYALFDNLSYVPLIRKDRVSDGDIIGEVTGSPLTKYPVDTGKKRQLRFSQTPFPGGALVTIDKAHNHYYYDKAGETLYEKPEIFVYYDKNGQLFFDKGKSSPVSIRDYIGLTAQQDAQKMLPRIENIPAAQIKKSKSEDQIVFRVKVKAEQKMPYGIAFWGNYEGYSIITGATEGAKILGDELFFVPMVLEPGGNEFEIQLKKNVHIIF